jgi:hypothetical protein
MPTAGCASPYSWETSSPPPFIHNWPTKVGEIASLTRRPTLPLKKITSTYLYLRFYRPRPCAAGRIRSVRKSNDIIGSRTRYHPAASLVPTPSTLLYPSLDNVTVRSRKSGCFRLLYLSSVEIYIHILHRI